MPRFQLILLVIIIILGGVFGGVLYHKKNQAPVAEICPADVMACPDGSTVPRSGANCKFGICKQELPSYMEPTTPLETTSTTSAITQSQGSPISPSKPTEKKSVVKKVTDAVDTVVKKVEAIFTDTTKKNTQLAQQTNLSTNQTPTSEKSAVFNETRYVVKNNSIIDGNGNIIYTFPPNPSVAGWTTTIVNVVPTNSVTPVINSIPIVGQPGQFYISENSLGNIVNCEFSNRVYILDTKTGTKILMYEENNNTVGGAIARSCTSELFLLATEGEKLILKSHTIGTGSVCESTWSEPEQTWYLDVTKLEKGLRRYIISPALYYSAESKEKECRVPYEATSTPVDTLGG